ncbi:MAG TPA: ABC transporter permease subunit [Xanthobacteraceae bacterium]|nr:ABC transporter permease subunit [Xanthobacteraceae bacterium]
MTALLRQRRLRALFYQVVALLFLLWLGYEMVVNATTNVRDQGIATGLGFLSHTAGFGINQTLIPYKETDSFARVFVVGLLNTLLVSILGIIFATIIGFIVGIARLSSNWLVSRLAGAYVEVVRNLPLLFHILFWYLAVLRALPTYHDSYALGGAIFLNNRGLYIPGMALSDGWGWVAAAALCGIVAGLALWRWAVRAPREAGSVRRAFIVWIVVSAGALILALYATGFAITFTLPTLGRFNIVDGIQLLPELAALLIALSTYTAGFIAEIVRSGVLAVPRGQTEAAYALGLSRGATLRRIVVPQALRVIIPPLGSQYLNLMKNSSLATAIGYPDLFALFAGTTLNQTGQAIEIIGITMLTYLVLSLAISGAMNLYNARMRLKER